jgi:uncharacterized protein (DUF1684 family)|tara:strand:- start:198 stop:785 length:588 start_codon:yes stop_codon:yes gene_type:complete
MIFRAVLILFVFVCSSCDKKRIHNTNLNEFQKQLNASFKDATTTPFNNSDLKRFSGLDFFQIDSNYIVKAEITLIGNAKKIKLSTSTGSELNVIKYAELIFMINAKKYKLFAYKYVNSTDYPPNHLFVPFLDKTNGYETYGGGRYLDLYQNSSLKITIDFNNSYNPLCAYNESYSCPLVPKENFLDATVKAGVKY